MGLYKVRFEPCKLSSVGQFDFTFGIVNRLLARNQEVILQELDLLPKPEVPPKKKPGRPKGSKKKEMASVEEPPKKKRGRPKGSKNKPKDQPVDRPEDNTDS